MNDAASVKILRSIPALVVLLMIGAASAAAQDTTNAQATDSAMYIELRARLLEADSAGNARYVQAADELAQIGMYAEAARLMEDLSSSPSDTSAPPVAPQRDSVSRRPRYRISVGADYFDINDVLPQSNRAEEQERDTLLRHQQFFYLRAGMDWRPQRLDMLEIGPEIYIGNRKASLSLAARADVLAGLRLDVKGVAEKQFWQDYNNYDTLVAFERDTSDMLGAEILLTPSGRLGTSQWHYRLPFGFATEQYLHNTLAFTSFLRYGAVPRIEYRSQDLAKTASVQCEVQYKDYGVVKEQDSARAPVLNDSSDYVLLRPEVEILYRVGVVSIEGDIAYSFNQYPNNVAPERFDQVGSRVSVSARLRSWIRPKLTAAHSYEAGRYRSMVQWLDTAFNIEYQQDSAISVVLSGNRLTVEPECAFYIKDVLTVSPVVTRDMTRCPAVETYEGHTLTSPPYLVESCSAWEPGLRLGLDLPSLSASLHGSYRIEDIDEQPYYSQSRTDNNAVRFGGEASGTFFTRFSAYVMEETELKYYDDTSEPTTNISLSAGLSLRF